MRKVLLKGDVAIIDGVEFTTEEIKNALVEQHKFHKLSDFLRNTLPQGGVTSE